jgi:hypothetical protein
LATLLQDVGIDHGVGQILVPEQALHGADVGAALQQVRGERMAKGVGADGLRQTGTADGHLDGLVDDAGVNVMATGDTGTRSTEMFRAGKTYCQPHSLAACGAFRASA